MSTLMITNVEPEVKERLMERATRNGHSVEVEIGIILKDAVGAATPREVDLAEAIRLRFAPLGGVDHLETHPPDLVGEPLVFEP